MANKTKIIKISLLLFSTVFALVICEIGLRVLLYFSIGPESYVTFSQRSIALQQQRDQGYDQDQFYELMQGNNHVDIIALGDSFTNGGNVPQAWTYPVRLHNLSKENFSIYNMGVCEDTTPGAYMRLKNFVENTNLRSKRKFAVILIGAADFFNPLYLNHLQGLPSEQWETAHQRLKSNPFKSHNRDFWLAISEIKTFKLLYYIFKRMEQLALDSDFLHKNIVEPPELENYKRRIAKCLELSIPQDKYCIKDSTDYFVKIIENEDRLLKPHQSLQILARSYAQVARTWSKKQVGQQLGQLFVLLELYPQLVDSQSYLKKIVFLFREQSHYSALDFSNLLSRAISTSGNATDKNEFLSRLHANSLDWVKNEEQIATFAKTNYHQMISLLERHGITPILMTYPVDYHSVNTNIRDVSNSAKISLIDLELHFSKKVEAGESLADYIDDFDHATAKGYGEMASLIYRTITGLIAHEN